MGSFLNSIKAIAVAGFFHGESSDILPENQISTDFVYIEIIKAHKKPVISYNPASKLVPFQTGAFFSYLQFSQSACTFHISQDVQWCQDLRDIAVIVRYAMRTGIEDITNFHSL